MFSRGAFYRVFVKYGEFDDIKDVVYVREGFCFLAVIFGIFWTLFNRLWLATAIVFTMNVSTGLMELEGIISQPISVIAQLCTVLWLGFAGTDLKEKKLLRKHYILEDIIFASSQKEAEIRLMRQAA